MGNQCLSNAAVVTRKQCGLNFLRICLLWVVGGSSFKLQGTRMRRSY